MNYTTGQVMAAFNISRETVRNWATEFARHLSPRAKPGKGQRRQFTHDDMRVFALVSDMKKQGAIYENIHASLDANERGNLPPIDFDKLAKVEQHQQIATLQTAITQLTAERDDAISKLRNAENEAEQQRGMVTLLKEQLSEKDEQVKELYIEIATLKTKKD